MNCCVQQGSFNCIASSAVSMMAIPGPETAATRFSGKTAPPSKDKSL